MAGNYPDVPDNRIPYDKDGAIWTDGGFTQFAASAATNTNKDNSYSGWSISVSSGMTRTLILPYNVNLVGLFLGGGQGGNGHYCKVTAWSPDTTNGIDGTWNGVDLNYGGSWRTSIQAVTYNNCRAVRSVASTHTTGNANISGFHMYGRIVSGQVPDRLEIWHPTLSRRVFGPHFDWGNVPRQSSADLSFRVKNQSSSFTANSVSVTFNAESGDTTPPVSAQHYLSTDGINFSSSLDLGALAPGALSPVITVRRITPSNAVLGLWSTRIRAVPVSWT